MRAMNNSTPTSEKPTETQPSQNDDNNAQPSLTFWQALGLLALCRILFGGFGAHGFHSRRRRLMTERWERMTPEEREKCRRWFHGRWGGEVPPDPAPGT